MDAMFTSLPLVGILSGYLFHPRFLISNQHGTPVMRLRKRPAFFEGKFRVELLQDGLDDLEEWRLLLALLMMVLLERARG